MDKNSMLSFKKIAYWSEPLSNLTRFNHSIIGVNSLFEIIEVDTRDSSIDQITEVEHRNR